MHEEVNKFIEENFDINSFQITDFKIVPGGKILTDATGATILIFFDIEKNKVVHEFGVISQEIEKKNKRGAGRKKIVDVDLIKKLRAEGKSQEQVARDLNISISTVRRNQK